MAKQAKAPQTGHPGPPIVDKLPLPEETPRPVTVLDQSFPNGARTRWHSHRRTELVHASGGLLVLNTEDGTWTAPAGHALLVAANVPHELAAYGCSEMRAAFLTDEALGLALPTTCRVIAVSELLDIALRALAAGPLLYDLGGRGGHLAALITDEITKAAEIQIALPVPQNKTLRKLCRELIQTPSLALDLDGWSDRIGVSRSTFTRRFRAETGLSFAEWRRRLRMLHALTLRADGAPLRLAAQTAGYRSTNALRDMMRRTMAATMTPLEPEGF
ncbi:helix-turn-helix transcriptional regulator [Phreatobacter stygius]|uniref:Helix-turn-helix transcriptional regulator n=1 Tax=Phreatobacter stygius TaxID=1940610 RepID=A0A4D7B235_9HYPH|nr:helix-turn-helix transcriptional regulator [Phreatobacter stygius]